MSVDRREIERRTGLRSMLAGGTILAAATMAASAGNYVLNVLLGRWLGAGEFSDANLMVTLMLLVTAIAMSLQLIAARFASKHHAAGTNDQADRLARWLELRAALVGMALGAALIIAAPWWSDFFNTRSAWPFVILGMGLPFYLAQGVGRGVLQGRLRFGPLALTYLVEMVVRVVAAVTLVALGFGVAGATLGLSASFVATWVAVRFAEGPRAAGRTPAEELRLVLAQTGPVAVLLAGQIIMNNEDVLLVKRNFEPELAGAYAGVALIGRAVFFLSWSVATTIFPAAAQRDAAGSSAIRLLVAGVVAVAAIGGAAILGAVVAGESAMAQVFGEEYVVVARYLPWYALATSMLAIANLVATYELGMGRSLGPRIMLAGAVGQTILLFALGRSLDGVVTAQVVAMTGLAVVSLGLVGPRVFGTSQPSNPAPPARPATVTVRS